MARTTLLYHDKQVRADGSVIEMKIWQLPRSSRDRPHALKYRLYFGLADGTCLVRYDNETGKGDHRHIGRKEELYEFSTVEQLMADFLSDVQKAGGRK